MINEITDWIKELADNTYTQAEGTMCSMGPDENMWDNWDLAAPEHSFCCLGVRRFLATPEIPDDIGEDEGPYELDSAEPENWERKEYGLTKMGMADLMGFNDGGNHDFPAIAREILMDPKYYFGEGLGAQVEEYFFGHTAE